MANISLRRVLWATEETEFIRPMNGQGCNALFNCDERVYKFSFDDMIFSPDETSRLLLCSEANTTYIVCAAPTWIPTMLPRPNSMKHFPNVVSYEYPEGICLLVIQCTNTRDTNALLLNITNILRAMQTESYIPFGQHPVTKYLRAAGYLQKGHGVCVVVRLDSAEATPEECLRLLRFCTNIRVAQPSSPVALSDDIDVSPIHKKGLSQSPTKRNHSPTKRPTGLDNTLQQVKHENVELQDLVVKMASQIQALQSDRAAAEERQRLARVGAGTQMILKAQYDEVVRKNKELERRDLERMRSRILTKEKENPVVRPNTSSPGVAIGPSDEVKARVKQQSTMIATMKKKLASMETELLELRRRDKERTQHGTTASMACEGVQRKARALEEHCERLGPESQHNPGLSAVRAALIQLQMTAQRVQSPPDSQPLSPDADLYALQSRIVQDVQQLQGALSLIDTYFKLEQAIRAQR